MLLIIKPNIFPAVRYVNDMQLFRWMMWSKADTWLCQWGKGPNEHTESKASTICGHSDFMHFFCGGKKRDHWRRGRRKKATERASKKTFVFVFVQGDHSRCSQPRIVIITKVLFYYESHVVKRNLCFGVNGKEVGNNVNGRHVSWSQHKKNWNRSPHFSLMSHSENSQQYPMVAATWKESLVEIWGLTPL